jgi:ferric-dicitrate binding protein FerR (iron transport regulator)
MYFQPNDVQYQTADESLEIILPDSSHVWLNRNSLITYHNDFNKDRKVTLAGEAFFDVKRNPDKPFLILADEATVSVLGTSFNIKAYSTQTETEVYVLSGKVKLATQDERKHVILTPGLLGVLDKNTHVLLTSREADMNALAWKNKELIFKKTPLRDVLKTVRSYFKANIDVKNKAILNCRFTSSFKDPTLPEVLEAISLALNLKVDNQSNTYALDGEGCIAN